MSEVLFISAVVFIFGIGFWIAAIRLTKRVRHAVESLAVGSQRDVRIMSDQWGGLGRALNELSDRIDARFQEIETHESRLEATFLSMFDGVMILDREGNILLMNEALRKLLDITEDVSGRKPMEVIRNQEIQDLADAILSMAEGVQMREISLLHPQEKILMIHATPIVRSSFVDGVVLVFHDITDLRKLESLRRDFVANVSHELRTPMTNIKGYSETLLDGALEDQKIAREFVQIINTDADRLTQLIDDLLHLARIESGKMSFEKKLQNVKPLVDQVMKNVILQARQRNVILVNDVSADAQVEMDGPAMEQVFYNLIDNAIKYNRDGGRVTVSSRLEGDAVIVSVTDTGVGIPEEDLPRIFERFYRVDKSHSRKVGGTGLGLSIVKHILQLHGGDVSVHSRTGEGTTFDVRLLTR